MDVFQLEPRKEEKPRRRGLLPIIVGFALLTVVGSTLAANITLNTNDSVNFAQGIAQTVSCDVDGVTVSPTSSAPQNIGAGPAATWYLATITVSGISNDCLGKQFVIQAYDNQTPSTIMQIGQTEVSAASVAANEIRFRSSVSGWAAEETGTKDWSVSGTWAADNDNAVTIQVWYPNRLDGNLTNGWAAHDDNVGIVSGELVYFTIETTE